MEDINDRLKKIIDYVGMGQTAFEEYTGISRGYIAKSRKSVGSDIIRKIYEKVPNLNLEWLLIGEGSMLREEEQVVSVIPISESKATEKSFPSQDINLYDIDVSAGLSRLFAEDGEKNRAFLGKISIPNMPRCDGAVKVIGDSMYPLLKSGDIIAYKEVRDRRAIQWGEIYILQIEYDSDVAIVVKYVKRSEKGDDWIKLVSYNKEHDPKDIELANVKAIARVMVCIRQMGIM